MSAYLIPIQTALILFPILAALMTLPYAIHQYRSFGSMMMLRVTIVYSFVFYLLCAYFLVILPLPPVEEVAQYTSPYTQTIPFMFVHDLMVSWNGSIGSLLKQPACYQVVFNLFLLFPLGVYLRYYFRCSLPKLLLITFLISLSFECLQLSGLFGIYPRPYRLFDVDDLIINTAGGFLGCLCTPLFAFFLPNRTTLDLTSYHKGTSVSGGRRVLALGCDSLVLGLGTGVCYACLTIVMNRPMYLELIVAFLLAFIVFDLVIPICTKAQTLGKRLVKIRLVQDDDQRIQLLPLFYHFFIRDVTFLAAPLWFYLMITNIFTASTSPYVLYSFLLFIYIIYWFLLLIQSMSALYQEKTIPLYNKLWRIHNVSTIVYDGYEATKQSKHQESEVIQTTEAEEALLQSEVDN